MGYCVDGVYDDGTRNLTEPVLCEIANSLSVVTKSLTYITPHISFLCVLINLFHFTILTRKPMRGTSINIIMAAAAICDIFSFIEMLMRMYVNIQTIIDSCYGEDSYSRLAVDVVFEIVKKTAQRASTWLILMIAFIRALVIRYPMRTRVEKLTTPKVAFIIISVVGIISIPFSLLNYNDIQFMEYTATTKCFPNGTMKILMVFGRKVVTYNAITAIVTNDIPCVLFPILSLLLVIEIRKADKNQKRLTAPSHTQDFQRTTRLVLYNTLIFFVTLLPLGITRGLLYFPRGLVWNVAREIESIAATILTVNTTTHCIIYLLMSSQYRETAKRTFLCGFDIQKLVRRKSNVITVVPAQSSNH